MSRSMQCGILMTDEQLSSGLMYALRIAGCTYISFRYVVIGGERYVSIMHSFVYEDYHELIMSVNNRNGYQIIFDALNLMTRRYL